MGHDGPLLLCADESFQTADDLPRVAKAFGAVNIKLDKCGGLTSALALADLAGAQGLELMVGNMIGSSLGKAPAHLIAQSCRWCDLDGPLALAQDVEHGLRYLGGRVDPPGRALWG